MLTVRQLISVLEDLAIPDAQVWAQPDPGLPFEILGGFHGETSDGKPFVILAPRSLPAQEGGF